MLSLDIIGRLCSVFVAMLFFDIIGRLALCLWPCLWPCFLSIQLVDWLCVCGHVIS